MQVNQKDIFFLERSRRRDLEIHIRGYIPISLIQGVGYRYRGPVKHIHFFQNTPERPKSMENEQFFNEKQEFQEWN